MNQLSPVARIRWFDDDRNGVAVGVLGLFAFRGPGVPAFDCLSRLIAVLLPACREAGNTGSAEIPMTVDRPRAKLFWDVSVFPWAGLRAG